MQRRNFIQTATLSAIAISATGFVRFDGKRYVGDCETTSDILGPYYRPDSPVRSSLVLKGEKGDPITLMGKILHNDCSTPYKNAKIELWHCDGNGVYDNESADYKYRGTVFSDQHGNYAFQTILPVPYDMGNGTMRPAHFHLMVTAEGYQPLVTQLYFTGDKHIKNDKWAGVPTAQRRLLDIQTGNGGAKKVMYNVAMAESMGIEPAALDKLAGVYTHQKNKKETITFFKKDNVLWLKNNLFGANLNFIGNNTFQLSGSSTESGRKYIFQVTPSGGVELTVASLISDKKETIVWTKNK